MTIPAREAFATRLNDVRLARHLSISAVARLVGVPKATAQGWLNGSHLSASSTTDGTSPAGDLGAVRIWTVTPGLAVTDLCARIGDPLTPDEWRATFPASSHCRCAERVSGTRA